ncbi:MAG: glutamate 5-kinase [Candidatus Omnitrophota bacterium]|nr:MAG: glutamate 5-kinase [Candidatus Omnitrophota bacterium]
MKKIVVKIGSSVIAPKGKIDANLLGRIVRDALKVEKKGYRVVFVSSGAIACGLNMLKFRRKPHDTHSLMAIASLGQIALMDTYAEKLKKHKRRTAQILLTWDDFDNRKRFVNARQTIDKLLSMGVVAVINENDAVSSEEIRFGDNDRLSALVGDLIGAQELIMLSDVEGLLEGNKLVKQVSCIDNKVFSLARKEDKMYTAGGMFTKLEAAKIATSSGIKTVIASGRAKEVISRIVAGEALGTCFLPVEEVGKARKRWIAFSKKIKGKIYIDEGAKEAIVNKGKSLLSVGIIKIEGQFGKGDGVQVLDEEANILGCGITHYSSDELRDLKGKRFEKEIIHRDNFVKG